MKFFFLCIIPLVHYSPPLRCTAFCYALCLSPRGVLCPVPSPVTDAFFRTIRSPHQSLVPKMWMLTQVFLGTMLFP